jgi:hypothetical protein
MIAKREKAITTSAPRPKVEVLEDSEVPTNADEALLILGIACRDPRWNEPSDERERLLLEPWAVKAALSRRAARRMDRRGIEDAQRCTRDADTLRWPEPEEP